MARLEDPVILAMYVSALSNWHFTGYIEWQETCRQWVRRNLQSYKLRRLGELMYHHVCAGGEIDQVRERRPEWNDREYHYDLRITIGERRIYIETILIDDDPKDPIIKVVSIHDA